MYAHQDMRYRKSSIENIENIEKCVDKSTSINVAQNCANVRVQR